LPGTLLVAVVPRDFWVVANFRETQIPEMQTGRTVAISVDAIPGIAFRTGGGRRRRWRHRS